MNEQEAFWKGSFGDDYVDRNNGSSLIAAKVDMFNKALSCASPINSIIELGANRGLNADALKVLLPESSYTGVEIGDKAYELLRNNPHVDTAVQSSIHSFTSQNTYDLAFVAGVLIHLNPNTLSQVYNLLARLSSSYVLISEYFNPEPVELSYRGNKGKLFKRDFSKEFADETGFRLIDYGFVYRYDPKYCHDDMNWFLLQR